MERRTVCPYDCPDSCGMIATIENNRLVSVRGDMEHPRTKGYLCRKTKHYEDMVNHPDRILYPMKRTGEKGEGKFTRISWEEALSIISERWKKIIERYGAEAILPYSYAGTEGKLQENCGEAFFHYMGASRLKRTICSSGKGAGWKMVMGDSLGMPSQKISECDQILIWSSNIAATRIHEIPYIQKARQRGANVTLIDVYKTPAASFCDETILIRPGSDGALALAMVHVMEAEGLTDHEFIEKYVQGYDLLLKELPAYTPEWAERITGIPAERIRKLAIDYGRAERAGILLGSGASRQQNGAMGVRCICALPAVTGQLGKGYGISGIRQTDKWVDLSIVKRPDFDRDHSRTINMMQLASALDPICTNPPVKSLYVYNSNPLNVTTRIKQLKEAMMREDLFTVVHERFLTDTALYADILLPAVFSLESYDIFTGYGYNAIQYSKKIIDAPGECLSNWDTFVRLSQAMGYSDPFFSLSEEEMCMKLLDGKTGQQKDLSELEWGLLMDGYAVERPRSGALDIRTESGKVELFHPGIEKELISYESNEGEAETPIHLVAAPSLYTLNSTFTSQEKLIEDRGRMTLILSSKDAKDRGISQGDIIVCENALAQVLFYADVREDILPGTAVAEGIHTFKTALNGLNVNALFSEELSDLGEATTMNGNYVQIRKYQK